MWDQGVLDWFFARNVLDTLHNGVGITFRGLHAAAPLPQVFPAPAGAAAPAAQAANPDAAAVEVD